MKKILAFAGAAALGALTLTGCTSDADTAGYNLSREAESFNIERRIVFYNGITDAYLLEIVGKCSVDPAESLASAIAVTCKEGPDQYKKHYLGRSDNVGYFVEQLDSKDVSEYHTTIVFKPEAIVPDVDLQTSITDGNN